MYFGKSKTTGEYTFSFIKENLDDVIEISDEEHIKFISSGCGYITADENGLPIFGEQPKHIFTEEDRLQERMHIHANTDNDYAKYSRQVRLGIDVEHSQAVLDYIDQYNQQVSDTVNQEGFPQEVTYPEYVLP